MPRTQTGRANSFVGILTPGQPWIKCSNIYNDKSYANPHKFISLLYSKLNNYELEVINWVKNNTNESDIFLIDESYNLKNINIRATGFEQNTKRPTVVNENNVYGSPKDIKRWASLISKKREIFNGNCDKKIDYQYLVFLEKKKYK